MPPPEFKLAPSRLALAWLGVVGVLLGLLAVFPITFSPPAELTQIFLGQDKTALALSALGFCGLCAWLTLWRPLAGAPAWGTVVRPAPLALFAVLAGFIGWRLVCQQYALSYDEVMARFDAVSILHGHVLTPVAPIWRRYIQAMQPHFLFTAQNNAAWSSAYLPFNALFLAPFEALRLAGLANALLSGLAVLALYGVARRLWPARRDAAVVASLLLVSSSQFVITAMTPYAMSAHLALNLVWLWLFLRGRARSDIAAIVVAFVACGLHQFIFHPLFAAPFILHLYLTRQRRRAAGFMLAYGLILTVWLLYWHVLLRVSGYGLADAGMDHEKVGLVALVHRIIRLVSHRDANTLPLMLANIVRFIAWQNPLAIGLCAVSIPLCLRQGGLFTALILGPILMLALVFYLLPWQGHGWGYRYLHGFLGSVCLIAAAGWVAWVPAQDATAARTGWSLILASTGFSLAILLPWRAVQAHQFIRPFALAEQKLLALPVDVVVLDAGGTFFGGDLVRNDPLLQTRPKILHIGLLDEAQVRDLCIHYRVALVDAKSPALATLRQIDEPPDSENQRLHSVMARLGCGGGRW